MLESAHTEKKNDFAISTAWNRAERLADLGMYQDLRRLNDEQKRRVSAVFKNELTERQRQVLSLSLSGMLHAEIALELGVSPSTISRTFYRGIRRLQRFLRY